MSALKTDTIFYIIRYIRANTTPKPNSIRDIERFSRIPRFGNCAYLHMKFRHS